MYSLTAVVEREQDWFVSHCVELGVASQGKTHEEAVENLKDACRLYLKHADKEELAHLKKLGKEKTILSNLIVNA